MLKRRRYFLLNYLWQVDKLRPEGWKREANQRRINTAKGKRSPHLIQAMLSLSSVFSALIFLFSMFCCSTRFGRQDEVAPRPPLVRPPPPAAALPRAPPRPFFCRNTSELAEEKSGRKEEPGTCCAGSRRRSLLGCWRWQFGPIKASDSAWIQ